MASIEEFRRFYAEYIVKSSDSPNDRLIAAFSRVRREDYVGLGPWPVFVGPGYLQTNSDDPRLLYQDIVIGLATERRINNGQPTLHARCLAACDPRVGESAIHIGAGTGYYTAVLSDLVGDTGNVTAFEIEADLAERARVNLSQFTNVVVRTASGSDSPLQKADVIYVSAGATHPLPEWLDALNVGGRLIFPLTPNEGLGCTLLVTRTKEAGYTASVVTRALFIPCIGARDETTSKALTAAFETRSASSIRSLRRNTQPDSTAWCIGAGWWLSTSAPANEGSQ